MTKIRLSDFLKKKIGRHPSVAAPGDTNPSDATACIYLMPRDYIILPLPVVLRLDHDFHLVSSTHRYSRTYLFHICSFYPHNCAEVLSYPEFIWLLAASCKNYSSDLNEHFTKDVLRTGIPLYFGSQLSRICGKNWSGLHEIKKKCYCYCMVYVNLMILR